VEEACPFAPRGAEEVDLAAAAGRVLAGDLSSPEDVPSFRRADRDGFAVRRRGHVGRLGARAADPPPRRGRAYAGHGGAGGDARRRGDARGHGGGGCPAAPTRW